MEISEKILNLRKAHDLTQEQLAEKLDVQGSLYQNGSRGKLYQRWINSRHLVTCFM